MSNEIPIVKGPNAEIIETRLLNELNREDKNNILDGNRLYDGQPWTQNGERGRRLVEGLTMRDISDCLVLALIDSSGKPLSEKARQDYLVGRVRQDVVYELDLSEMDPIAISQNLGCWIERRMGIFPNTVITAKKLLTDLGIDDEASSAD